MKPTQSNRPAYSVYVVEGEGDKAFWTKIGAGFKHEDGEGFNLLLSALPIDGRLVVRTAKQSDKKEGAR